MSFLVLLCAHCANADETELMPLKNELKRLIAVQEEQNNIPSGLLLAIAMVESGSEPYALNIQGKSNGMDLPNLQNEERMLIF
jgi:soluble lytic murein transglycosylase-like protein